MNSIRSLIVLNNNIIRMDHIVSYHVGTVPYRRIVSVCIISSVSVVTIIIIIVIVIIVVVITTTIIFEFNGLHSVFESTYYVR